MSNNNSFLAPHFIQFPNNRIVLKDIVGDSLACTVDGQAGLEEGDIISLGFGGWVADDHEVNRTGRPQEILVPVAILQRYIDGQEEVKYDVSRNGQPHGTSATLVIEIVS